MGLALSILEFAILAALWWWLLATARPWITARVSRWLWHRLGGEGDPPAQS